MIEVSKLRKVYGEQAALDGVSFAIQPGEICGYLGPNGAGKSTTVKILTGTLDPTEGDAAVCGFSVRQHPIEVKRRIGYVPESSALYETLTVEEHLALVGALHGMAPDHVAERADTFLELFGIQDARTKPIAALSKGMRQKTLISCGLLHDPEAVLFDEPLSGLDANAAGIVRELLEQLRSDGKTVLYCSHILDVVERLCDRVIILNEGRIVAQGQTDALIREHRQGDLAGLFQELTAGEDEKTVVQALIDKIGGHKTKTS